MSGLTRTETAVILATDLVGSTEIASRVGSVRYEELRREHDSILGDAIEDAAGRVIKNTGDGLLAAFPSVTAALAASVAIQQQLDRRERTAEIPLKVRIGISVGDAAVDEGDYFGIPPIEATRLCAKARGGEILVADPVRAMLRDRAGHRFESLPALELKGLPAPVVTWRVGWNPLPRTEGAALPSRLRGPPPSAYVGRAFEQAFLAERWDRTVEGHRQVVLVSGEPGIGKTRLITQTARTALPDDTVVLYGRCDEDQGIPYHPWLEILRDYVEIAPRRLLRPHAAPLARLIGELTGRLGTAPAPAASDPDTERYLLFTAVGALLAAAADRSPLLVILDDLHWADRATLQLLKYLVTAQASGRMMLLGAFRDSDLDPDDLLTSVLADLRREAGVTRLALDGLEPSEIVDLIEVGAGHPIDAAGRTLAGQIHQETAGNPFFVGEMIRHLRETGAIAVDGDGRWSFRSPRAGRALPQSVREVVGRRVARLGPDARRLLSSAAVIGPELDLELLGRVASLSGPEVLDLLDEAATAALLTRGSVGDSRAQVYAFSHGLVQATLYAALAPGRRAALHAAVGRAIEEVYGDDGDRLPELAHHHLEAAAGGDIGRAVEYARRAAERAMGQFAYDQAETLLTRALDVAAGRRPHERIGLLQALGEAQMRGGDTEAARRTLLEAAAAARREDKPEALARASLACGIWGLNFGVDEDLVELAEEAIARLEGSSSRRLLAEVKGLLGAALYFAPAPRSDRRHRLCAEAVALARQEYERTGDRDAAASLAYVLGRAMLAGWGPESAAHDIERTELLALCRRLNHLELELLVRNWRTTVLLERGDFAAVERELARVEAMATELGHPRAMVYLPLHRGMRLILTGRFAEAERLHEEYLNIGVRTGLSTSEIATTAQVLVIRLLQGRTPELEAPLRALAGANPGMVVLRCALVMTLLQAGREDEARLEFEATLAAGVEAIPADNSRIVALALLAEAAAGLGDAARARVLYAALAPYGGRWVVSPTAAVFWPVERSLGQLAGAAGEPDRALAHLASARALGEPLGALPTLALIALDEACVLAGRGAPGDGGRVGARAGEARRLATRLGMRHVSTQAARLEADAGGYPRHGSSRTG